MSFSVEIVESPSLSFLLETGFTDWLQISNKPTTLAGYGITDALRIADAATTYATLTQFLTATGNDPNFAATVANSLALKAPLTGVGATGTWPISVSGAAATAALATLATAASNIAAGAAGSLPYQTASATTAFLPIAAANGVLTSNGSAPVWSTALTLSSLAFTGSSNPTIGGIAGTLLLNQDFSLGARAGGLFVTNSAGAYSWSGTTAYNTTPDTYLYRDGVGIISQRNGANAQGFRVFNTFTDASSYEMASLDWIKYAGNLTLSTQATGTGTARGLVFEAANAQISFFTSGASWQILAGALRVAGDNTGAIGGISSNRPGTVYSYTGFKATGAASSIEVWNTNAATSTVNYEKGVFDWSTTANTLTIGSKAAGTGTQRNVVFDGALHRFDIAGAPIAYVQSSGLTPTADGSKSLGQQTAYRWQYVYAKAGMQITGGAGQFVIYNLDPGTSGGNNEYGSLDWTANAGTFTLGTYASGAGLARTLRLQSASVLQLYATQGSSINAPSGTPPIDIRVNNVIKWNTNGTGDLIATAGVKLTLGASTTSNASINIPSGTAPTTPADGDIWSDGTNLKFRVGGATYTIQKA